MSTEALQKLFAFIPLLENGALKDAHSIYIQTGEYDPQVSDLQVSLRESGLCHEEHSQRMETSSLKDAARPEDAAWMIWADQIRPFLQEPERILSADRAMVDKLLTMAVHSEKLNKSFFPHLCSSGFILMLLKRLRDALFN